MLVHLPTIIKGIFQPRQDSDMKKYDFDKIIGRRGSGAVKTDALKKVFGKEELIPMWVADMDFETPDFIVDALKL